MDETAPVRITFSRGSAAAVNRTFIGWFFVFAILFAGAAFYRPAIQAFAVGFPIYLVLWKLRLRRATVTHPGQCLVVSRERLSLEGGDRSTVVGREEADSVRMVRQKSRFGGQAGCLVLSRSGSPVFRLEIDDLDIDRIAAALTARRWPLD